jgi:superoxide dismutase
MHVLTHACFPAPPHTYPAHPRLHLHTHTQVTQVKLPYDLKDIAPTIDAQTMDFHFNTHYKAYVDNLNKALGTAPAAAKSSDLTSEFLSVC